MTSRRGFIAQLAALAAAGTTAPAMLARLRPSSRPTNGSVGHWDRGVKNTLEFTARPRALEAMLTTGNGQVYRVPVVDGVANFHDVLPAGWITVVALDAHGEGVLL